MQLVYQFGQGKITSRIGLERDVEKFVGEDDLYVWTAHEHQREPVACVLVDEAQFLTPKQVLQLSLVVDKLKIPVLCYGLRTDFRGEPFPGSAYLLGWADELVELKTICKSGKKATFNARLDENGNRVTEGDQISIGLNYEAQARDVFELDKVSPIDYQIPEANQLSVCKGGSGLVASQVQRPIPKAPKIKSPTNENTR